MRPPKDDTWMYNQDPAYGLGWRRSEEDYVEALTLLVSNSDAFRYLSIAAELMTNDRHGGEHQILHDPRFSAGRVPATSSGY